jgi:integrase
VLTVKQVVGAWAAGKPYKLSDGGGLYLQVTGIGSKTGDVSKLWRYQYRIDGKQKLLALGKYPDVSLAEAREAHQQARKLVAKGIDPSAQRQAEKQAQRAAVETSFGNMATLWLALHKTKSAVRHYTTTKGRLVNHILPLLGGIDCKEMKRALVVSFAKQIEKDHGRETADRCLMVVRQVLNYAADNGHIDANVAAGIKPDAIFGGHNNDAQTNHARVSYEELPQLLRDIEAYSGKQLTVLAMKLMALTLLRTSELTGLTWSEIDFEEKLIRIPAERMKAHKPHIVPLSRQALDILGILKHMNGSKELVFPMSNMAILMALGRMGYHGRQTGHGFRGIGSTVLHESRKFTHEMIETALAHQYRTAVAGAYDHAEYVEPRREMMQWLADEYDRLKQR